MDPHDAAFWRILARLSDDADFRKDPTLHARIPRVTYVQATPSNMCKIEIAKQSLLPSRPLPKMYSTVLYSQLPHTNFVFALPYFSLLTRRKYNNIRSKRTYSKHLLSDTRGCGPKPRASFRNQRQGFLQQGKHKCIECLAKKECGKCQMSLPPSEFSQCQTKTPSKMKQKNTRRCNACLAVHEAEVRAMTALSHSQKQRTDA